MNCLQFASKIKITWLFAFLKTYPLHELVNFMPLLCIWCIQCVPLCVLLMRITHFVLYLTNSAPIMGHEISLISCDYRIKSQNIVWIKKKVSLRRQFSYIFIQDLDWQSISQWIGRYVSSTHSRLQKFLNQSSGLFQCHAHNFLSAKSQEPSRNVILYSLHNQGTQPQEWPENEVLASPPVQQGPLLHCHLNLHLDGHFVVRSENNALHAN